MPPIAAPRFVERGGPRARSTGAKRASNPENAGTTRALHSIAKGARTSMDNFWAVPYAEGWAVSRVGEGDHIAWYNTQTEAERTARTLAELERSHSIIRHASDWAN